ncbi:hypothetical protein LV779_17655 [Streptomyces thinghirensis]|nr:hypothetical protein [Streptomyces thinghirensis]
MIAVQAESATLHHPLGLTPEGREGFQQDRHHGPLSMAELRRLLGVLRTSEGDTAPHRPAADPRPHRRTGGAAPGGGRRAELKGVPERLALPAAWERPPTGSPRRRRPAHASTRPAPVRWWRSTTAPTGCSRCAFTTTDPAGCPSGLRNRRPEYGATVRPGGGSGPRWSARRLRRGAAPDGGASRGGGGLLGSRVTPMESERRRTTRIRVLVVHLIRWSVRTGFENFWAPRGHRDHR